MCVFFVRFHTLISKRKIEEKVERERELFVCWAGRKKERGGIDSEYLVNQTAKRKVQYIMSTLLRNFRLLTSEE